MTGDGPLTLQFRPRARIIRTIGDQLISGPEAAVIELVKNAYDADATFVSIRFTPPLTAGSGRITVLDNGHGMTLSDIQDKWMEPATSTKADRRTSTGRGRTMMGSKGIGRFAAAKLGRQMGLSSISDRTGKRTAVLIPEIDWADFNGDTYLSDISIDYLEQPSEEEIGTEIEIRVLNETWNDAKLRKLHLELRRLISPLDRPGDEEEFRIYLDLSDCTVENCGINGRALVDGGHEGSSGPRDAAFEVRPFPLLTACDYEVVGQFDDAGRFTGSMQIRRAGQAPFDIELNVPKQPDEDSCGNVGVHLFLFDREANVLKENLAKAGMGDVNATEARRILDEISGIAIYRDGFRIRPYGDPTNDWLTLDRRRVQDPSFRIGHNQIAGYITVESQGPDGGLQERSSREGFEENAAFDRLQRLVKTLLAEAVEPRRHDFREKAGISRKRTTSFDEVRQLSGLKKIRALIKNLPAAEQAHATAVIDHEAALLSDRIDALEERQRVLEAKSSLGAIIGEVLHEGSPAATFVLETSERLQRIYPDLTNNSDRTQAAKEDFPRKLHLLRENGTKLTNLFSSLQPLAGGKRGPLRLFYPQGPISSAKELFTTHKTIITIHGGLQAPQVMGHPDDLSTAVVNLFNNSIHWLEQSMTPDPRIDVWLERRGGELVIYVDDNGPGISKEFVERVFEVGFTLKDGGTGLGLNIAREALARSDATLGIHLDYEVGTRFEIRYKL